MSFEKLKQEAEKFKVIEPERQTIGTTLQMMSLIDDFVTVSDRFEKNRKEAIEALRERIDGGEELRGHDQEITRIINILER